MSKKKYFLLFVLICFLCLVSFRYINKVFVEHVLANDGEETIVQLHETIHSAKKLLNTLPKSNQKSCDGKTVSELTFATLNSDVVRWLGLRDSKNKNCNSLPVNFEFNILSKHELSENFYLAVMKNPNFQAELLLIKEGNDESYYIAALNNWAISNINSLSCERCLHYELVIHGKPPLEYSGKALDGKAVYGARLQNTIDADLEISVTYSATNELSEHYSKLSWVVTIAISLLIATITTLLLSFIQKKKKALKSIILTAVENSEFVPFYQPIIDSKTNEVIGAEALVRWIVPNGRIIPPGEFIEFAEKSGLIIPITSSLIKQISSDIALFGWANTNKFISINIVPEHLYSDDLFSEIREAAKNNHIKMSNFSLEITERFEIQDLPKAKQFLELFYDQNIDLKLDDAGTGYGGFSYVQELGISTLKIDKMFTDTILNSCDVKRPVLDAIISFAKSSKLNIVAEGVEDSLQIDYLDSKGVTLIQGFVYSKPIPRQEFLNLLSQPNIKPYN